MRRGSGATDFTGFPMNISQSVLPEVAPEIAKGRVIVAHLGSGASMCAIHGGRSVESTMGFTALDGLPMGTRTGQIDPGVVLYLMTAKGMSAAEVQDFLYRDCGLKGLSGVSNDMRELQHSSDPRACLRRRLFRLQGCACRPECWRLPCRASMPSSSPRVSAKIPSASGRGLRNGSNGSGCRLIRSRTRGHASRISRADSRIPVYVVPTDEELMIAQHTLSLLWNRHSSSSPKRERAS